MITRAQSTLLRRLAIGDVRTLRAILEEPDMPGVAADPRVASLVRLGSLVAIGGDTPAWQREVNAARDAGATTEDIIEVLRSVAPVTGSIHVMSAAPRLALALGYDVDVDFETLDGTGS